MAILYCASKKKTRAYGFGREAECLLSHPSLMLEDKCFAGDLNGSSSVILWGLCGL
jgi:hypothetical protein